jgi:hypothetical protein
MIWLQYCWRVIRQLGKALVWDFLRIFGLPMAIHPEDGDPARAILPQFLALQIAELAKMVNPELRPVEGTKASVKIIFNGLVVGPYLNWRFRLRMSRMAGLKFKTNQSAMAFLKFMAEELAKQERKEPQG